MDRIVAARKLLAELVKGEQLEVRRIEIVGRDLAQLIETLGRPPSGDELEEWLGEHAQVTELYAGPSLLDDLVYRYLTPPPPGEAADVADARHPELERQLREAPDGSEPYLVYADWLQERGDPFGELIALGVAATRGGDEAVVRFERHLKLHEARFLGGLARQLGDRVTLHWRFGVVHAIEERELAEPLAPPIWDQLLRLRACELLRSIKLRRPCTPELDAVIAAAVPATLHELVISCTGRLPEQLARRDLASLTLVGDRVAIGPDTFSGALERLELHVQEPVSAGAPGAPLAWDVRELRVSLHAPVAAFLAGVQLPRLERLILVLGTTSALQAIELLGALRLPALAHLALRGGSLDPGAFSELARLPLAGRLTSLGLTNLELTDEQMGAMARARGAFASLAELDVSHNELSREGLARARELAPSVISQRQQRRGSGMERRVRQFAGSRLQAAEGIADPELWRRAGIDGDLRFARYRGEAEYELYVTADLERYGCTCPSSIQPCKHVVALALVAERTALPAAPSDGVEDRVNGNAERYGAAEE